jgi:DUF1365 family protein
MRRFRSAIYEGVVGHLRLKPRRHRLRYRIFWLLADLDELPELARANHLFAYNRPGLISFFDRDHGDRDGSPLRPWAERLLRAAGLDSAGGRIELLSMPRVLNHVFNPLSVWFCHTRTGALRAVIYEVNNTFGQRYSYVIPVADGPAATVDRNCAKAFHVSPFMPMDLIYRFRVEPPAAAAALSILASDSEGPMLAASFHGVRREISDRALLTAWLAHPLLSLKVLGGIHWEAAKLWLKLQRVYPAPHSRKPDMRPSG